MISSRRQIAFEYPGMTKSPGCKRVTAHPDVTEKVTEGLATTRSGTKSGFDQ